MIKSIIPELSVDEIMVRIREEVEKMKKQNGNIELKNECNNFSDSLIVHTHESNKHSISNPEIDDLEHKTTYNINEFLKYHDHKFVEIAYNHILQRPLDAGGKSIYLESLRQGRMSKIDILGRLCFSPEGRRKKVKIKKLILRFCFHTSFRIPILGNFFRILLRCLYDII